MVKTRNMKRKAETPEETAAVKKPLRLVHQYMQLQKIATCVNMDEARENLMKFYTNFNTGKTELDYYEKTDEFLYDYIGRLYFRLTGGQGDLTVSEEDIWHCLCLDICGSVLAIDDYIDENSKYDETVSNFLLFETDAAEFYFDLKNAIDCVLGVYTGKEYQTFEPKFGLIKTEKLGDKQWVLSLNEAISNRKD